MEKKKLLVSFSGGETSAFMGQWLLNNKQDEYEMVFVFANTGQEHEETLEFVKKCDDHFGFGTHWIESKVHHGIRKGSTYSSVDFDTASRNGEPFEEVIKKYGIPNRSFPICTRETKQRPMEYFAKKYFGTLKYYTAIGIRSDEADRMSVKKTEYRLIYPLVSMIPMTRPQINSYWRDMPFRLNLKSYQGNCKTCWKKTQTKLFTIARENPEDFDFMDRMEKKYPRVGAEFKKDPNAVDRVFFRESRTAQDIIEQSKTYKIRGGTIKDEAQIYEESCEVFSNCGEEQLDLLE